MVVEQATPRSRTRLLTFAVLCSAGCQGIVGEQQQRLGRRRAGDPDPPAAAQEEAGPPVPAQGGRRGQEARAGAQAAGEAAGPADAVSARAGRRVADVRVDRRADGAGWRVLELLERRQQVAGSVSGRFG